MAGEEAINKFQTFNVTEENRKDYRKVVGAFKERRRSGDTV